MIDARKVLQISLEYGEKVVAVTSFRDYVLVITDFGSVYRLEQNGS